MKKSLLFLLLLATTALSAEQIHPSRSVPSRFMGSIYYNTAVGYNFSFETEGLDLYNDKGQGALVSVTLVVPGRASKLNRPPFGEYRLGSSDSLMTGMLDYYESNVAYYTQNHDRPDKIVAFRSCQLTLAKAEGGGYDVKIAYTLANGSEGEYHYRGKLSFEADNAKQQFKFQPKDRRTKNWTLTKAEIEVVDTTAYGSRTGMFRFECGDLKGHLMLYLPMDGVNGRYEIKYGKQPYSMERTRGGYDHLGYFTTTEYGAIEDEYNQLIYFPYEGYVEIRDDGLFFEFTSRDWSKVRGTYKGTLKLR